MHYRYYRLLCLTENPICANFRTFQFYVKPIWQISAFKQCKNSPKSKFRVSKCVKMAFFAQRKIDMSCYSCTYSQCGNFRIFLSLRFHVKSTLDNSETLQNCRLCHFRGSKLGTFGTFHPSKSAKVHKS